MNAYTHTWRAGNKRADRGLPAHPDGSGLADCPACKGTGIHFGYCPTGDDDVPCAACEGNGCIDDGGRDVLIELHDARIVRDLELGHYAERYASWRRRAMRPVLGILQLRMVEAAIGCDVAARGAVQAWRAAA